MKRSTAIFLTISLFAVMCVLTGCGKNENSATGDVSYIPDDISSESYDVSPGSDDEPYESYDQPQETSPDLVQAPETFVDCTLKSRDASERSDSDYSKVYEINCGGEYIEHHYLYCDAQMNDLRCVSVEMNDDGSFILGGVYSQIGSVMPGEAVYLTLEVPEVIPNTAIIYTADGVEYIWLIGYNGRDGGISLVPLGVNQLISE